MTNTPANNTKSDTAGRPAWADTLRDKYLAGEASIFVLYGNVFDHVLNGSEAVPLIDYLKQTMFGDNKALVAELGWSQGLQVVGGKNISKSGGDAGGQILKPMSAAELSGGGVGDALRKMENVFHSNSAALLIPYAATLVPAGDPSFSSNDERAVFTTLHRWSLDSSLSKSDCVVVLIAEALQEINPGLLSSPRVATIEIGLPDELMRERVIRIVAPGMDDGDVSLLAAQTSGLRAIQVERIVAPQNEGALSEEERAQFLLTILAGQENAEQRARKLAAITAGKTKDEIRELVAPGATVQANEDGSHAEMMRVIHARKREIIEKDCAGLISFIESKEGLSAVGGNEKLKKELMEIAGLLKSGNRKLAPMGLLCVGPMGSGKTFVVRALLKEAGLTGVALKNFRSKWNGATEANLERVLATVKAMGPIAVVIDESDRSFGGKDDADADGGVSARVMARLKEFMSDTDNRGQVLFILMTNRPDRIETDLKRPGRLDRKIPFFYCDTAGERALVLRAILTRCGDGEKLDWTKIEKLCEPLDNYSNADLEAVGLLALEFGARQSKALDEGLLQDAINDFIPPREEDMILLMELLAAQETSRRSLLPEKFAAMSTKDINAQINALRQLLRDET
jgi:transitional endoplasmic reticulum ATPase